MTEASTSSEIDHLPWTLVGALLVAMAAHWFTIEGFLGLPLCGLALLLSQFTSFRLPNTRGLSWSLRAIVLTFITIMIGVPSESVSQWYVKPAYTNLIGCLLAAEIAIRAWERHEPHRKRESRGVMLLLAVLTFAVATNTGVRWYIHRLAPLFAVLIVLSLRTFSTSPQPRKALLLLRGAVMLIAIGIGFVAVQTVTTFDHKITTWAIDLLGANRNRAELGLSGSPRLGAVNNPEQSMERVLRIDGPRGERHLRALAFDTLENRQWKRMLRDREFRQVEPSELGSDTSGAKLAFTRIGETLDLLPLPPNVAAIEVGRFLERDDSGALRDQDTALVGAASRYVVAVPTDERFQGPVLPALDETQKQRALQLPEDMDTKVVDLARQVGGEGDPMSRVMRLALHLRSNHAYSLSYDPGGSDPLSDFILNKRAAHCQYFASALVVMSRAIGVPARFVTGYYAHEPAGDDAMVVRQRDAHAWAECWIDGVGWITMDATPPSGLPDQLFAQASSWRRTWEWISDLPGRLRDWLSQFSARTLVMLIVAAAVIVPLVSLIRFLLTRRRRKVVSDDYAKPSEELVRLAHRFDAWLKQQGVAPAPNRTWREQAMALDPICLQFIEEYDQARFGGRDGAAVRRASELIEQVERASVARVFNPCAQASAGNTG